MGIANWFESFNQNLRMSADTVNSISYRYKRITNQLNKDFYGYESETLHSLYVGSYGRGTEIWVSDIDVIFQLPSQLYSKYNAYSSNGQSALLQAVKQSIERTYKSSMKADGQVIVVSFTDGITFELIPAFINTDGSFTFADTNNGGSWKVTNPRPEIEELTSKNIEWNKNLKRLCRMARSWKEKWDVPIGGLLIDTLAYNFMNNCQYKDKSFLYYDYISRDFFKFLSERDQTQSYWLSPGARQYVWRKGKFENKSKQCYELALEAISKESNIVSAKSKWREIYGTKFPS